MNHFGEKCGVFGVFGKNLNAARITFFGLYALQHRGQESSGITSTNKKNLFNHSGSGLVSHVFNEEVMSTLIGGSAIGHNRYSTSRKGQSGCSQPIFIEDILALAHNGNISNTKRLVEFLSENEVTETDMSDSEMITEAIWILVKKGADIEDAIEQVSTDGTGVSS